MNNTQSTHWAQRALSYARSIASLATVEAGADPTSETYPGRGSATAAETKAAQTVCQQLSRLGIDDVETQTFQGMRSIWLFFSLAFGAALAGHAAYWLLAAPAGRWFALLVSLAFFAFSAYLLWRKFTFHSHPLQDALPQGPSQNVLAVLPPTQTPTRKVVLVAHLDSHRAVFWYANDFLMRLYALAVPLVMFGVFLAPLLYIVGTLSGLSLFAVLGLVFAGAHFLTWLTGMTADLGPYSPGANDNASAVGTVLALAEHLQAEPLAHTEVWLAFTGCEETGCGGLLKLLETHGQALRDALWLDFELVGIGDRLAYLTREGVLRKRSIPDDAVDLLENAAREADIPLDAVDAGWVGVFTEAGALWEHGYTAACLVSLRENSSTLPEWHRLTDTADRLEIPALARTQEMAWQVLQSLDQETTSLKNTPS